MVFLFQSVRKKPAVILKALLGILVAASWTASAQPLFTVDSTTDGNGLFSYTFTQADPSYIFGVSANVGGGGIFIQSYDILDVISPPGWTASVDSTGFIDWYPTSGTVFIGQPPLTFSVQSSSTEAITYDQNSGAYFEGILAGEAYTLPDLQPVIGGVERFSFLGPQLVVPEPSSFALFAIGIPLIGMSRRFFIRRVT